jgi:Tfp pilus assembly protein PilF
MRMAQPVVLYGLGGVGKSQLALAYLQHEQRRFDVVWWVRAEQRATAESDLVALARALHLPDHADSDQQQVVAAVRHWLGTHGRWLLVLDNAQGDQALEWVLPANQGGRVLLTSRNQLWRDATVVWVRPWSPAESLTFLRTSLSSIPTASFDVEDAQALASELGHLPIALEQAVAFVRAAARPIADYLSLLRTRPHELFDLSDLPDDVRTVAKTWAAAMEQLQATPGATELLAICAFFAPDNIPRGLIPAGAQELAEPLATVAANQVALDTAVITLRRFSFVDATDQILTVHRLVQAVVRHRLGQHGQQQWAASAVRLVSAFFPSEGNDVRSWPACEALLPHALSTWEYAERLSVEQEATGRLLNNVGLYLRSSVRIIEAKALLTRALAINEAVLGPDHPNVAAVCNNLGRLLQDLGDRAAARTHFERALAINEAARGPDHPQVAVIRNNLGGVLLELGDLAAARTHFERALAIDEVALGPDHPEIAHTLTNLGIVLTELGDLAGARTQQERALAILEAAYGPNHPIVATVRSNLGSVLFSLGDPAGARLQQERALAIDEAAYGPNHPEVATDRSNLGMALKGHSGTAVWGMRRAGLALAVIRAGFGPHRRRRRRR